MKLLLPFLFGFIIARGYANDTLTRAQVYNFNIGDTFQYETFGGGVDGCPLSRYDVFETLIIQQLYYSINTDTLFICQKRISNVETRNDTISISNLAEYELFVDSYSLHTTFAFITSSPYNGRIENGIDKAFYGGGTYDSYAEGLGKVKSHYRSEGPEDCQIEGTTNLIYYSKGTEHWGNYVVLNVDNYPYLPQILLTPNPASSFLNITSGGIPIEGIRIYNTTGQLLLEIKQPQNNTIDISSLSNGVYLAEIKTKAGSVMKRWVKL